MTNRKDNYLRGDRWEKVHKYPSKCYKCGLTGQKKDFIALYLRIPCYDSHRILARLCPTCLATLATDLGVTIPEEALP